MLSDLLRRARSSVADDLAAFLADSGRALGAADVTVYLVDPEQYVLVPLPRPGRSTETLPVNGTVAGRAFRDVRLLEQDDAGGRTVWAPVLDGLERLGVVRWDYSPGAARASDAVLDGFGAAVAELVVTKAAHGDLFHRVRRRRPCRWRPRSRGTCCHR